MTSHRSLVHDVLTSELLPAEPYASSSYQRQHRVVRLWQPIMSKPAHVQRLRADIRAAHPIRDHQVLHIEVIGGSHVAAGHLVLGQQQRNGLQRKIG